MNPVNVTRKEHEMRKLKLILAISVCLALCAVAIAKAWPLVTEQFDQTQLGDLSKAAAGPLLLAEVTQDDRDRPRPDRLPDPGPDPKPTPKFPPPVSP